jgi:protein TonB
VAPRPAAIATSAADGGGRGPPRIAAATAPRHDAAYLKNPPPPYPVQARRRGLEGRVLVRATVAATGECTGAELRRSSGHAILDEAALRAVRAWHFVPAMRDGRPVAAGVDIPIVFRLED